MLEKSSIFLMLILGVGSLIGISSIYKPANVETQPQPQSQQPGQIQPPTEQQQQQPTPIPGGKEIKAIGRTPEQRAQIAADNALLDRLFPKIIQRIDGATLLQKIDARTLANKMLPYLDISASVVSRDGPQGVSKGTGPISSTTLPASSVARCNTGEIPVSGGFAFWSDPADSFVNNNGLYQRENGWVTGARMGDEGSIKASVTCLTVKVGLKNAQQPQPQQPSLPPGGPPLRPPPPVK